MALTAMAIYKYLPRTNCGDCKLPTCMAFAMQVAAKQKALTDCPHLSERAKAELGEFSAPPMRLVKIGSQKETCVEIGQETVMFRHEEKFHHLPVLAARIPPSLSEEAVLSRIKQINASTFTRIGQQLGVRLVAIDITGMSADKAYARVKTVAEHTPLPLVIMSDNADTIANAVTSVADKRPLLYRATPENAERFIQLAAKTKCPLAIHASTLEKLADISVQAKNAGVMDIILSFEGFPPAETIRMLTIARRSALKKTFRPLGYPAMVNLSIDNLFKETALASSFVAKYAGIIVIDGLDPAELITILTVIQNIYTDPQVPNEVESKVYEIGNVNENSPVMFTTNFSLTYFSVASEVERSKIPSYICVIDTEGLGVLNSYAGDKLSPEKVVKELQRYDIASKVRHRKLIIPGLLPSFRAEIEDTSEWKEVLIGPENASGIPAFLTANWRG